MFVKLHLFKSIFSDLNDQEILYTSQFYSNLNAFLKISTLQRIAKNKGAFSSFIYNEEDELLFHQKINFSNQLIYIIRNDG